MQQTSARLAGSHWCTRKRDAKKEGFASKHTAVGDAGTATLVRGCKGKVHAGNDANASGPSNSGMWSACVLQGSNVVILLQMRSSKLGQAIMHSVWTGPTRRGCEACLNKGAHGFCGHAHKEDEACVSRLV